MGWDSDSTSTAELMKRALRGGVGFKTNNTKTMRSKEFNEWKESLDFLDSKQSVKVIKDLLESVSFGDRLKLEKYIVDEIRASNEDAEDEKVYNGIICNGSIALGSACMKCEKCKMELEHLDS